MSDQLLQRTVAEFNCRHYSAAGRAAAEALVLARGRDEAFWQGICETCDGYTDLVAGRHAQAEVKLVGAMQKLRNFGYRYRNLEVTGALAGIRAAVAELRAVRLQHKRVFDISLLPQLRLAAKADDA
ncbi:MAG: hypothetical protein R6X25_14085 [Candidatus Krumholzibacteriia bacterium]